MRNLCVFLVIILSLLIDFSIALAQGKIVFAKLEPFTGESDIYVADIDSRSNIRNINNITMHPSMDNYPTWSPDVTKVSFTSVLVGLPVILVVSMLPVSIAGLGLREMIASVVMVRFFITQAQAVTASLLLFCVNGFLPGLVGIGIGAGKIASFSATQTPKPP